MGLLRRGLVCYYSPNLLLPTEPCLLMGGSGNPNKWPVLGLRWKLWLRAHLHEAPGSPNLPAWQVFSRAQTDLLSARLSPRDRRVQKVPGTRQQKARRERRMGLSRPRTSDTHTNFSRPHSACSSISCLPPNSPVASSGTYTNGRPISRCLKTRASSHSFEGTALS